ncbi:MAG: flagellar motor protein MotB [Lachnospiraceae bacterium]|jgi:chemotaxis protein MotB|nr:flagellar motor protein MotB [Lachnospiraceae bacterium]
MAKKKEEFKLPPGTPAPWMSTFSDMMTLLMCFFVLLFSMSEVDAAKFEDVVKSFQSTVSIFKAGSKAVGDGILISNGVSQLNMLDEYINSSGKTAEADNDDIEDITKTGGSADDKLKEAAEQLELNQEEIESLKAAIDELEEEKLKLSEELAEKMEDAFEESMMEDKVEVSFTGDYVTLTLNGAFLFDSGKADIKSDAIPVLNKIGVLLTRYADSDIEIEGHTDSVPLNGGRYENNDVLSSYRALAVFNYLKENAALDPGVMKHSGRGEYIPITDNSTPEGRAKNRRVEIKIYNALSAQR